MYVMPGMHKLPPLPYSYQALEPVIGAETLRIHHDIHHKAYVNGLNRAELYLEQARKQIISSILSIGKMNLLIMVQVTFCTVYIDNYGSCWH